MEPNDPTKGHIHLTPEQQKALQESWEKDGKIILSKGKGNPEEATEKDAEDEKTPVEEAANKKPEVAPRKKGDPLEIVIADLEDLVNAEAQSRGDAKMTESKEDRSGNFLKRFKDRVWKHNLQQERFRQNAISEARNEILGKKALWEGDEDTKEAIIQRFANEYKDEYEGSMLKEGEKISPEDAHLNEQFRTLIREHAQAPMTKEIFDIERDRILRTYGEGPSKKGTIYADNLFKAAETVRTAVAHGESLDDLTRQVKVRVGKAREGLNSEIKKHTFDKGMEWLQNSKVGKYFVNEGTIAAAAGIYSAASALLQKGLRSKFAQWMTFGGAAVASGVLGGFKESARLERERVQDMREYATGAKFGPESKRRQEFEKSRQEVKSTADAVSLLEEDLASLSGPEQGQIDSSVILNHLGDIEARISLGEKEGVDLFKYKDKKTVEVERTQLLVARAKLKNALRESMGLSKEAFAAKIKEKNDNFSMELTKGDHGIEAKNKIFKDMKHKKVAWHVGTTMVAGAVTGVVAQEGLGLIRSGLHSLFGWWKPQDTWIQGEVKSLTGHQADLNEKATSLEALRRYISGETPRMPMGNEVTGVIHNPLNGGDYNLRLPEGVTVADHGNGTFDLVRNGETLVANAKAFTPSGQLDPELKFTLLKHDIYTGTPATVGGGTESTADYIKNHPDATHVIHREHLDNNTPHKTDFNEGKTLWGGKGETIAHDNFGHVVGTEGTGIDENGDYVLNVGNMTPDGSFHGIDRVDIDEALREGKLKIDFSANRDSQQHIFDAAKEGMKFTRHGNQILVTIQKNSEIGRNMFETNAQHHAVFTGKYGEVVKSDGFRPDGSENVKVLSTFIGHGRDTITTPGTSYSRLDVPGVTDYTLPDYIPLIPRTPLEAAEEKKKAATTGQRQDGAVARTAAAAATVAGAVPAASTSEREYGPQIPVGGFRVGETVNDKKELKEISPSEYDALKADIDFLNKKIQAHEGIITVNEGDLKSEYIRGRYNQLKHIPEGKPVTFNKAELRVMADEVEKNISESTTTKGGKGKKEGKGRSADGVVIETGPFDDSEAFPATAPAPDNLPVAETGPGARIKSGAFERDLNLVEYNQINNDLKKMHEWIKSGRPVADIKENELDSWLSKERLAAMKETQTPHANDVATMGNELQTMVLNSRIGKAAGLKPIIEEAAPNITANNEKAPASKMTVEQVLEMFDTPDDIILRDYLLNKELYIDNGLADALIDRYNDAHNDDGTIVEGSLKNAVEQIKKIKEHGQEPVMEQTASKLVSYVNAAIEKLGAKSTPITNNKTWAYSDIATAQYRFDNAPEESRKKDWIGDPLAAIEGSKEDIKTKKAKDAIQKIADMQLANEIVRSNPALLEKVTSLLSKENTEQQKNIDRIQVILKRGKNATDSQLIELGRLVRETQGIESINETKETKKLKDLEA